MSAEAISDHDGIGDNVTGVDRTVILHLAAAIVVSHDRVLVVRRSKTEGFLPSVWGVPCGKLDSGETGPEAAIRELQEETGLAGKIIRYLGQSSFPSVWQGKPAENIQSNFLVELASEGEEITLPKDDQAVVWLSRAEVEHFDGLDIYNRNVLGQWLRLPIGDRQLVSVSSMAIASSC